MKKKEKKNVLIFLFCTFVIVSHPSELQNNYRCILVHQKFWLIDLILLTVGLLATLKTLCISIDPQLK